MYVCSFVRHSDIEVDWDQVARIAKKVIPLISGRVLAQTSTSHAYDTDYIVGHARLYAKSFEAEGITR